MLENTDTVDVVLVGGGLSGLRAAVELRQAGYSCVVLEALDQVGGKTVGLNAAWIHEGSQSEICSLVKLLGLSLVKQHLSGTNLCQKKDGGVLAYASGFGDETQDLETRELHRRLNHLADIWLGPDSKAYDSVTLKALAEANCLEDKKGAGDAADSLTEAYLGVGADEVSALFMIQLIKSTKTSKHTDSILGGKAHRILAGTQYISARLAALLPQGCVRLSEQVKEICQEGDRCLTKTASGQVFHSKKVVVVLEYSEPWWRKAGLSGFIESSTGGPVSVTHDTCMAEEDHYSLTCSVVGESGRIWSSLTAEERRRNIVDHVGRVLGSRVKEPIPLPTSIVARQWLDGTMPAMPPDVLDSLESEAGKTIGKPWGNVHFVGAETADVWKGWMDGALRSGVRGAKEVIQLLVEEGGQNVRSSL
ncbi:hypothetical protein B0T16DRAFT_514756 [Cercophora newfieldiana]|uniref:Amine oxidase n=1 Tax=Cercophora newfieldiana TaxID=92897 RepID=A0AA39XVB9_9PEZI|nr:hypothetical protein B0T16DRAFT_514756 [Cercophora newfieldiana]